MYRIVCVCVSPYVFTCTVEKVISSAYIIYYLYIYILVCIMYTYIDYIVHIYLCKYLYIHHVFTNYVWLHCLSKIKNPDVSLRPQVCATIAGFMWRAPLKIVSLSTGFCLIFLSTRKRLRPKSYRRRKSFFDRFADFWNGGRTWKRAHWQLAMWIRLEGWCHKHHPPKRSKTNRSLWRKCIRRTCKVLKFVLYVFS